MIIGLATIWLAFALSIFWEVVKNEWPILPEDLKWMLVVFWCILGAWPIALYSEIKNG